MDNTERSGKKIVIIDDEPDLREIYGMGFKSEGFDVFTAENGEIGLSLIREEHPDAILLDLDMPVMNGFEVLKALKEDVALVGIPVVVLSNIDDEKAFRAAEELHTSYYLLKVMTTPQKATDLVYEILKKRESENVNAPEH